MDFGTWSQISLVGEDATTIMNVARETINLMKKEKLTQHQAEKVLECVKVLLTESQV